MTRLPRRLRPHCITMTALAILASCSTRSGIPDTTQLADPGLGTGDVAIPDATKTNGDIAKKLADAISRIDGQDAAQSAALAATTDSLAKLANDFKKLQDADTSGEVASALKAITADQQALKADIEKLKEDFPAIADSLLDLISKQTVLRYYNRNTGKHLHTFTSPFGGMAGWVLEGGVFNAWRTPRKGCNRPLYGCYLASADDYYIALRSSCDGGELQENLGYLCESKPTFPSQQVFRYYGGGDHMATVSDQEKSYLRQGGYAEEGSLGYAPL